jgi:hypothetical protein
MRALERSYVSGGGIRQVFQTVHAVSPETPGGYRPPLPPNAVIIEPRTLASVTAAYPTGMFEMHINNHGRTTTHLYRLEYGFCDFNNISDIPKYEMSIKWFDYIGPGTQSRVVTTVPIRYVGEGRTAIFGRYYHRDIWGKRRSDGFIYGIPGPALYPNDSIPVEAPRAYTQERKEPNDRADADAEGGKAAS